MSTSLMSDAYLITTSAQIPLKFLKHFPDGGCVVSSETLRIGDVPDLHNLGSSVVISGVKHFGGVKLRQGDEVLVKTRNGKTFPMRVSYFADGFLFLAPPRGVKMGLLNKLKFLIGA